MFHLRVCFSKRGLVRVIGRSLSCAGWLLFAFVLVILVGGGGGIAVLIGVVGRGRFPVAALFFSSSSALSAVSLRTKSLGPQQQRTELQLDAGHWQPTTQAKNYSLLFLCLLDLLRFPLDIVVVKPSSREADVP